MSLLAQWEAWVELHWKAHRDAETGFLVGRCEQLGIAAQGKNREELEADADQLTVELFNYLDQQHEGGIMGYFKLIGVEVLYGPIWNDAQVSGAPRTVSKPPVVHQFDVAA